MEVTLNLDQMLRGEHGESFADTVREEVVDRLFNAMWDKVQKDVAEIVEAVRADVIGKAIDENVGPIVLKVLDDRFRPVNGWGQQLGETSIREQIVHKLQQELTLQSGSRLESDTSRVGKMLHGIVNEYLKKFREEFAPVIDKHFAESMLREASQSLATRLGIKVK